MSRRQNPTVAADFSEVLDFLKKKQIVPPNLPKDSIVIARGIHEACYSLILWRFRLKKLTPHAKVFIEELASDALQILPQVMMGYAKTTRLLVRGVLENVLRHIYYSDHPVEFARMNRETKWYMSIDQLCDYLKTHPEFIQTEPKFDAIAQIRSLYSDLSAGVHGRTVDDLEIRRSLQLITFDINEAKKMASFVQKAVQPSNFLLSIYQKRRLINFAGDEKSIILRSIPHHARRIWTEHPVE